MNVWGCVLDIEMSLLPNILQLAREVLDEGVKVAAIGVTTDEIDRIVHEAAVERECYPSPLNYHGFPKSCCTSINEVICHGIPDMRPLQTADICNSKLATLSLYLVWKWFMQRRNEYEMSVKSDDKF